MSEREIIDGLACPACRADIVIQSVRNTSHTLIWHCGRVGDGCDAAIRRTFRFPSLNILASDLLSYAAPSPAPTGHQTKLVPSPVQGKQGVMASVAESGGTALPKSDSAEGR